ncbi:MAG: FemAB family PEP-CTERM system-associated protein [Rhodocyclaceae bacterium]|nr:FemAB family PEP-CTERM system-associated protein [Rhodocyclaceae bacterium]
MDRPITQVSELARDEHGLWDDFVRAHPDGSFFHLSPWRGIMEEVFGHRSHYLVARRAGCIVGVLPLAEVRSRLFGHSLSSLPFCAHAGAVGDDEAIDLLEAEADRIARSRGVTHLELRNMQVRHEDWPRQDLYVSFRKSIDPDVEANLLAIPRKQRAMVRKGIKNGLNWTRDDDVRRFFALYADNVRRHGTPALSQRYFRTLLDTFGEDCSVHTVTAPGGKPLSSVLSFYFRGEVLPYYAGDDVGARALAANDFKYWSLMQEACERGYRMFDYGRSKVGTGPYSFKKNWGFEPQPMAYEYRLYKTDSIPQNNPMNPKYRAFIAMWRRLPLPVANALGPYLVRNLG